jgi:hypothetical protein
VVRKGGFPRLWPLCQLERGKATTARLHDTAAPTKAAIVQTSLAARIAAEAEEPWIGPYECTGYFWAQPLMERLSCFRP